MRKKQSGIIFKVDFVKAYDKVKWPLVMQMLKIKGFPYKWIGWIMHTIRRVMQALKLMAIQKLSFPPIKVRQGDSLSPLFFDLASDALSMLMDRARRNGLIKGVLEENIENLLI